MNTKLLTRIFLALSIILFSASLYQQTQAQESTGKSATENKDKDKNYSETYKYLNLFGDVFERVRSEYVEEVPDKDLIEYAVNG
ncbi:MAG: hypothetical protein KDI61_10050, partial [Alphaproteobacteria bacterium]|nr:hypothetical protein [Alphaproteobacteria bacterium]